MGNTIGSQWNRWDLHVHTASSYDSKYKGKDADELLCKALRDNGISAVAITDHFRIDKDRIANLRKIAPDIVFFPGVELRTDKGATNVHLILIFSEQMNLSVLSADFDAIMLRQNAKSADSDETIYWTFEDIVKFANSHDGLISIHAGRKTNGVDQEISNALPINQAIKSDIADHVSFFEVGRKQDIADYQRYVFSSIDEKPIIICSDCHDPRKYSTKEALWIKAEKTFEGLKQCLYQPQERVYVGVIPPALDRTVKNAKSTIKSISVHPTSAPKNETYKWFDFDLQLNPGLIAVIGNKGSGKSALSDIIAHVCKCRTMGKASFLNSTRFRKLPKNFSNDYDATICWQDTHTETMRLSVENYPTTIEDAQYLPQRYIEDVCNDMGEEFQKEIDRVIFSYVDPTERGAASDLSELITNKSKAMKLGIQKVQNELNALNLRIIKLEDKMTTVYQTNITDSLIKMQEFLRRHENSKPTEVPKPKASDEHSAYQQKLAKINILLADLDTKISMGTEELVFINITIDELQQLIAKCDLLEEDVEALNRLVAEFNNSHPNQILTKVATLSSPKEQLIEYLRVLKENKQKVQLQLGKENEDTGLWAQLNSLKGEKAKLIATADSEEKKYQKYLDDIKEWEAERQRIIGSTKDEESLKYFEQEKKYIESGLQNDYQEVRKKRDLKVRELFELKQGIVKLYREIYAPVEHEIKMLLGELDESIEFNAELQLAHMSFSETLLSYINQKHSGIFRGRVEAHNKMTQFIRETEFNNVDSVIAFQHKVLNVVDEDIDSSSKKVTDKKALYDLLHGIDYIDVSYKLKMGGRDLEELSPGERGIVLLVFYLALSQNNTPIIIDQPEDNLDNQSVYSKLVPCICAAKKKRQVIIVTHNPNIAIACDAEQIIYCQMNKSAHSIEYSSGAIEDTETKEHVVDVLEGTMPAFVLRQRKYD